MDSARTKSAAGIQVTVAGRLLLTSDLLDNSFFAVDRFTGREAWRVHGEDPYFGPNDAPVVSGDTAFVGSNDRHVYAVDVATGRVFWRTKVDASVHHSALCGKWVLANMGTVAAVDRQTGRACLRDSTSAIRTTLTASRPPALPSWATGPWSSVRQTHTAFSAGL